MSVELLWQHQWLFKERMRSKPAHLAPCLMCRSLRVLMQPEDKVSWSWPSQPLEHEVNNPLFLMIRLVHGILLQQQKTKKGNAVFMG